MEQASVIIECVNQVISDAEAGEPKGEPEMFNTRRVSKLLDMTARTIRFYEEMNIVTPKRSGVTRFFCQREVNCLKLAKQVRTTGLDVKSVAQLVKILRSDQTRGQKLQAFTDIITSHYQKLTDHQSEVQRQIELSSALSNAVERQTVA